MGARLDNLVFLVFVSFVIVCGKYSMSGNSTPNITNLDMQYDHDDNLTEYDVIDEEIDGNHSVAEKTTNYSDIIDEDSMDNATKYDVIDEEYDRLNASKFYLQPDNTTDDNNTTVKTPTGKNCTVCEVREGDRQYRIESIKKNILQQLNFESPPNMTGRTLPKVPRLSYFLERSEFQSDSPERHGYHDHYEYEDYSYNHNEHLFTIAKSPPPDLLINESHVSYFNIPAEMAGAKIKKAVLWYYTKPSKPQKTVIKVHIHKLKPTHNIEDPVAKVPLRYKKIFPQRVSTWHHLDIRKVVQDWVDRPKMNYGLQLVALDHNKENLIVNPPPSDDDAGYEPMIELKTVRRQKRRVQRSTLRCSTNSTERRCCRYPLRVNFIEFGWDWVIAPHDYSADYCSGECRFSMQDANHHATLQQHASSTGPCCTPTLLSPISMLYFDHDHNVIITNLQDMKVERCGCS